MANAAPEVAPLDVDGVAAVTVGTIAWAVATLVLLVLRGQLVEDGNGWWLWVGVAGTGLGLLGIEYCRRRRDALSAQRSASSSSPTVS
jgi:hypothetical protein